MTFPAILILRRTVVRSGVQHDVRFLGFVPIEVLRIFYDEAKIFVFPSLYEGFGLPPLEAMAHGTPVVTSNVSSLPEVVGNAAVLVNPENVFEIMRALHRVLMDQPLRERMKERGYQQATKFSWETSGHGDRWTFWTDLAHAPNRSCDPDCRRGGRSLREPVEGAAASSELPARASPRPVGAPRLVESGDCYYFISGWPGDRMASL